MEFANPGRTEREPKSASTRLHDIITDHHIPRRCSDRRFVGRYNHVIASRIGVGEDAVLDQTAHDVGPSKRLKIDESCPAIERGQAPAVARVEETIPERRIAAIDVSTCQVTAGWGVYAGSTKPAVIGHKVSCLRPGRDRRVM